MMDDLKDSDMWLGWADKLEDEHPDIAEYFCACAKERLEKDFVKTYELFEHTTEKENKIDGECLHEMVEDHIMEWHEHLMHKLKK